MLRRRRSQTWIASRRARNDVERAAAIRDLPIAPSDGRTTPKQEPKAAVRLHGRINDQFTGSAGHCRPLRRPRRAVAAADARREPPRPSVPDLGAVRGPGAEMVLRRISRARRRAFRRPRQTRHQARRICADPSRQLHRGGSGLVCLRRARRHRGHHQHPLGGGGNRIFRRPLRRGRRHHPARLCRTDLGQLPRPALDRGDLA